MWSVGIPRYSAIQVRVGFSPSGSKPRRHHPAGRCGGPKTPGLISLKSRNEAPTRLRSRLNIAPFFPTDLNLVHIFGISGRMVLRTGRRFNSRRSARNPAMARLSADPAGSAPNPPRPRRAETASVPKPLRPGIRHGANRSPGSASGALIGAGFRCLSSVPDRGYILSGGCSAECRCAARVTASALMFTRPRTVMD